MPRVLCRFVLLMLPPMAAPLRIFDRASVLHGVSVGLLTSQWAATVSAAERGPAAVQLLEARKQLEPCEALISEGSWDGVRTAIKTAPLAKVKAIVTSYIDELDDEGADDLVVVREDLVQSLQMLDMAVYNNNFIGEHNAPGKKGSGVKTDFETPRKHLREAIAALDEILNFGT